VHFESLHDYATKAMEGGRMITQGVNLSELSRLFDSQDLAATMRKRYMTTLSEADPAISRLWQVVQELEKTTDVLLIVASDHGEEFLEHGGFFHMGTLYQELVRVPLLVYTTGQTHKVIDTPVGLYRIAPSILKFLGFQGNFVADLDLRREPLNEFEIFGNYSVSEQVEQQNYMVVKNNTKLIYDLAHGQIELYDLKSDPGEHRNIFGDPKYRDIQQQLMVEMEAMLFYMSYGDLELLRVKDAAAAKGPGK
jgi:arylsulfatase A-like enzyme